MPQKLVTQVGVAFESLLEEVPWQVYSSFQSQYKGLNEVHYPVPCSSNA